MVLYGNKSFIEGRDFIFSVDIFFDASVIAEEFSEVDLSIMREIDGAVLLDKSLGTIQTKFGITDIKHLSSGCKMVLSYLYMLRHRGIYNNFVLNISECGKNAMKQLLQVLDDNVSIEFYVSHIESLFGLPVSNLVFNNKSVTDLWEAWDEQFSV